MHACRHSVCCLASGGGLDRSRGCRQWWPGRAVSSGLPIPRHVPPAAEQRCCQAVEYPAVPSHDLERPLPGGGRGCRAGGEEWARGAERWASGRWARGRWAGPVGAGPVGAGPVGAGPVGAGPVGAGLGQWVRCPAGQQVLGGWLPVARLRPAIRHARPLDLPLPATCHSAAVDAFCPCLSPCCRSLWSWASWCG